MKTKITLLSLFMLFVFGQDGIGQTFIKGTSIINAGIGIGGRFGAYSYGSQTPGLSLSFEHGLWEIEDAGVISLGAYAGIKSYKYEQSYNSSYFNGTNLIPYSYRTTSKWNYTIVGVRSAFHYNEIGGDEFDLYGGLLLSYNILSYKFSDDDPYYSYTSSANYGNAVGLTAFVGGRYYFNPRIAVFGEAGYGISYLTLGLTAKF